MVDQRAKHRAPKKIPSAVRLQSGQVFSLGQSVPATQHKRRQKVAGEVRNGGVVKLSCKVSSHMSRTATVPKWHSDSTEYKARSHERLLGSIQFYCKKNEGGAHWESSEDQPRPGLDPSLQATAPDQGHPPEWPGFNEHAALEGYETRYNKCKINRANFERPEIGAATALEIRSSDKAIQYVNRRESVNKEAQRDRKLKETRKNFDERAKQRDANKTIAVEASSKLVRPRPSYVPATLNKVATQSHAEEWYGRKNTRPW